MEGESLENGEGLKGSGTAAELVDRLELTYGGKIRGPWTHWDFGTKKYVVVSFETSEGKPITAYLGKWNSDGVLWLDKEEPDSPQQLKHHKIDSDQEIRWGVFDLKDE